MNTVKKKSFLVAVVCLILCVALLAGATFAWFSDSVSNTGNRIQAGTLDIDLLMDKTMQTSASEDYVSIGGKSGDIFKEAAVAQNSNITLWEPGKTQAVFLAVENKGNLAVKYNAYIDVTDNGLAGSLEYALFDEGTYVKYKALIDGGDNTWEKLKAKATVTGDVTAGRTTITTGILDEIAHNPSVQNERDYVALAVHMKESAGNEYQNMNAVIDVTIAAAQMTAEKDGFDSDQYDKAASVTVPPEAVHEQNWSENIAMTGSDNTITQVGGEDIPAGATSIDIKDNSESGVEASLPIAAAQSKMVDLLEGKSVDNTKNREMILNLYVDTTNVTSSGSVYDIQVKADISYTEPGAETATVLTDQPVGTLSDWLTAEINIGAGHENVAVTHNKAEMTKLESADGVPALEAGGYYYDKSTGLLTIKSKSFSPFEVSYGSPFAGGDGSQDNPYLVSSASQFLNIASGTAADIKYYKLTSDVILTDDLKGYNEVGKEYYFINDLSNAVIDGNEKIITTNNYSYTDGNPFIIYSTSGNVTIKNVSVSNGKSIVEEASGSLTFEGVDTFGTVSGSSNNHCARYLAYSHLNANITFDRCNNYSNIIGTGYVSAYIGAYYWTDSTEAHYNFNKCINYGSLQSTGKAASMLFANPTNKLGDAYITISDCENRGSLTFASKESDYDSTLAVNLDVRGNMPYNVRNTIYINGTAVITPAPAKTIGEKKVSINNAIATCLTGNQPERVSSIGEIPVEGGNFVLNKVDGAARYELLFSFSGHNGGNVSYRRADLINPETMPTDIKVSEWKNYGEVSGIEHKTDYNGDYYTSGDYYVYNDPGYVIRSNVVATLITYDSEGNKLSVSTYTYE